MCNYCGDRLWDRERSRGFEVPRPYYTDETRIRENSAPEALAGLMALSELQGLDLELHASMLKEELGGGRGAWRVALLAEALQKLTKLQRLRLRVHEMVLWTHSEEDAQSFMSDCLAKTLPGLMHLRELSLEFALKWPIPGACGLLAESLRNLQKLRKLSVKAVEQPCGPLAREEGKGVDMSTWPSLAEAIGGLKSLEELELKLRHYLDRETSGTWCEALVGALQGLQMKKLALDLDVNALPELKIRKWRAWRSACMCARAYNTAKFPCAAAQKRTTGKLRRPRSSQPGRRWLLRCRGFSGCFI